MLTFVTLGGAKDDVKTKSIGWLSTYDIPLDWFWFHSPTCKECLRLATSISPTMMGFVRKSSLVYMLTILFLFNFDHRSLFR